MMASSSTSYLKMDDTMDTSDPTNHQNLLEGGTAWKTTRDRHLQAFERSLLAGALLVFCRYQVVVLLKGAAFPTSIGTVISVWALLTVMKYLAWAFRTDSRSAPGEAQASVCSALPYVIGAVVGAFWTQMAAYFFIGEGTANPVVLCVATIFLSAMWLVFMIYLLLGGASR